MERITFRQYLESKRQLLEAVENAPVSVVEYEVRKYCSLAVGETEDEKELIGLRPKHKVIVEWRYDDLMNPTPENIRFVGAKDVDIDQRFSVFWTGSKLQKWLTRHASKGNDNE